MNARRDPDRLIHAFLLEGATELADQVYDAVRDRIEQKRQRVVIGPWRMPDMNKLVPIGLGAAAVVVVLVVGTQLLGFAQRREASGAHRRSSRRPAALADAEYLPERFACRIPPAADPDLHLADAWDLRVLPRGMDRSSGDRALDGDRLPALPLDRRRRLLRPGP